MIIKTRKYQLDKKKYTNLALANIIKEQWWLPVAIFFGIIVLNLLLNLVYENIWIYFLAPVGVGLYFLFWWIQFTGGAQMEQNQLMFERYSYEINGQQILLKVSAKEGIQVKWDMVKKVEKRKDAFLFVIAKGQFLYLPFSIFKNSNEIRFLESILQRKNLINAVEMDKNKKKSPK